MVRTGGRGERTKYYNEYFSKFVIRVLAENVVENSAAAQSGFQPCVGTNIIFHLSQWNELCSVLSLIAQVFFFHFLSFFGGGLGKPNSKKEKTSYFMLLAATYLLIMYHGGARERREKHCKL